MGNKKFYETDQFKNLQKQWNKKLKDSGFNDIESNSDIENEIVSKQQFTIDQARVVYNKACLTYLHKAKFKNETDRFIFEKHCEGISNRKIVELLPENGFSNIDSRTVDRRLLSILKEAGIAPTTFSF